MAVPAAELEDIAAIVNGFDEVNHNYEREHRFNLWFVVVASDEDQLEKVLAEIEERCGYPVLDLPLLNEHFIDLGFDLKWT
jgi:DNA-binding Lrp family transcriptional regulator